MPKRADLRSVLIVGSGPIRIGQGCEFDYAASQACRVLRREGLRGDGFESVQFHPEASPGPLDALPFFDRLAETCRSARTFARS